MISNDDKKILASTIYQCWLFNTTYQQKCQDIFVTLNRIWNNQNFLEGRDDVSSDTNKFKNLLEIAFKNETIDRLLSHSFVKELKTIHPLIHNDQKVSTLVGVPFNENTILSVEHQLDATSEHREFNKFIDKYEQSKENLIGRKFANKFSRLLYLVRSNIMHGSKINYEGSRRNEKICSTIYQSLLYISDLLLDKGLHKIASYGELRKGHKLHESLVINNEGHFVKNAEIVGNVYNVENTSIIDVDAELDRTKVEILEFKNYLNIQEIDIVENMPRSLKPYFINGEISGFAWVYTSSLNIQNIKNPILSYDRHGSLEEKLKIFLLSLLSLEKIYLTKTSKVDYESNKIFGIISIMSGKIINYKKLENGHSEFTFPISNNIINFLDEIETLYKVIFISNNENSYPFYSEVDNAIYGLYELDKTQFTNFHADNDDEVCIKMYQDLIKEFTTYIGEYACLRCGDDDCLVLDNLRDDLENKIQ